MKALHIGSLDALEGGTAQCAQSFLSSLSVFSWETSIITPPVIPGEHILSGNFSTHISDTPRLGRLYWIPHFNNTFTRAGVPDILHIHGLWRLYGAQAAKIAEKYNVPYVISLHGMLYPQAYSSKSFIKKLAMFLYQKKILDNAKTIIATCDEELQHYRALGFNNPVAIIPNYINPPTLPKSKKKYNSFTNIGYIGRINNRKRIDRLLNAFAKLDCEHHYKLHIMGDGNASIIKTLKKHAAQLGIDSKVCWRGFVQGTSKFNMLSTMDIIVLPSDFENFGMVVPEALSCGVPVIATTGTPWQDLNIRKCGYWVEPNPQSIATAIKSFSTLTATQREEQGRNGRALISEKYSMKKQGKKLSELYSWILNGMRHAVCPNFVFIK